MGVKGQAGRGGWGGGGGSEKGRRMSRSLEPSPGRKPGGRRGNRKKRKREKNGGRDRNQADWSLVPPPRLFPLEGIVSPPGFLSHAVQARPIMNLNSFFLFLRLFGFPPPP